MQYKLSEILTIIGGGTPKTTNPSFWGGDIPWLSVVDFNNDNRYVHSTEKTITKAGLKHSSTKILPKGALILSARGTVGALAQLSKPMAFNQSCYGIVATEHTTNDFLYYLLKTVVSDLQSKGHGSVFNTITRDTFETIFVSLPPLDEQKRIAGVLGAFDDKIELLQKQNTTLENMAKALFKSWFVDFDVVHAKQQGQPKTAVMQQYHLTEELYNLFPSSFEPSSLGPIPTGWQVKKITEFVNFEKGIEPGSKNYTHQFAKRINLPFYRVQDISSYGNKSQTFVSPELLKNKIFDNDDILVSLDATLGRVFIGAYGGFSSGIRKIITKNDSLSKTYILCFLRSSYFKHMLEQYAGSETTIKHAGKAIDHLQIVYDQKIVDNFNDNLKNIFPKLLTNLDQIQTLTEMRDALLPRLISGKIRV